LHQQLKVSRVAICALAIVIAAIPQLPAGVRTVLAVCFRQPYVIDDGYGLQEIGAVLAAFGSSDAALVHIVSGKMLFALPNNPHTVLENDPKASGYAPADTLYHNEYGLIH
jgi:beta-glucosidase